MMMRIYEKTEICLIRKMFVLILFFILTMFLIPPVPAFAQNDKDDNIEPLPQVLGKPRSLQVLTPFGIVSDTISIVVPPGRRNVQPQLALSYNAMGGMGNIGLGWQLDIGCVSRWRGDGTPTIGDPGAYSYNIAGAGGELGLMANGVYRAKKESVYREFRFENGQNGESYWVMDNGEGIKHYFGLNNHDQNSRIDGELWMLDYVKDGSGNTVTYQYMRDAQAIYIDKISYTGYEPDGDLGANSIVFEYENRPENNTRVSYGNTVREEKRKRLKRISVFTEGDTLVRRYELSYTSSALNGQSLLDKVTLVGNDDISRIVLRTFEYETRTIEIPETVAGTLPVTLADNEGMETGAKMVDVNGDGFADAIKNEQNNSEGIYLGDGRGNFALSNQWSTSLAAVGIRFITPDGDHKGADEGVRLLDVNSDGLPDIFIAKPNRREVWLNTGMGWAKDETWTNQMPQMESVTANDYFLQEDCTRRHCDDPLYADDPNCLPHCEGTEDDPPGCLPPHCSADPDDPNCLPPHCESTGEKLYDEHFALIDEGGDSKGVQLADINADGRVDIIWSMSRTDKMFYVNNLGRVPLQIRAVYLNTGYGWKWNQKLSDALAAIGESEGVEFVKDSELQSYDLMDVNGDGLTDIVGTHFGSQVVYLGTGSGWEYDDAYSQSLIDNQLFSLKDKNGQGLMPADFNDDGLIDYLCAKENEETRVYYNTGTTWETVSQSADILTVLNSLGIEFNTSDGKSTGIILTDIDGDGISDFVKGVQGGDHWLTLSKSLRDGLLVRTVTAAGEETNLQWGLSTDLVNVKDGVEGLPTPKPIVTEITRSDGRGNDYTSFFNYGGGLFKDRQFLGFEWSEQITPKQIQIKTRYYQDEFRVGRMYEEEWYDEDRLWKKSSAEHEIAATAIGQQIRLKQSEEEMIDPDGSFKSRLVYTYDEKFNALSVYRDPDTNKADDETTTLFMWAVNSQNGIWSFPARSTVIQGENGPVLSEFIMYYDDLPEGQADKGLASKRRSLVETGGSGADVYVEKSMAYDKYGNIVLLVDETGQARMFEYGDTSSTFRTRAIDPMARIVESQYDPGFGMLTWDKDASGNETVKTYDAFGRLTRVTLPGDDPQYGTRSYLYSDLGNAAAQWIQVKETELPGQAETLDTKKFFDGMGRVYRVEREGPEQKTVVMKTEFDDADNPVMTTRPFFDGDSILITEIERDKLHRPIRVTEPDGTSQTLSYAGLRVEVVDGRDKTTSFYKNAEGSTTEIHQWIDGNEQITRYGYDPLGHLVTIIDALGEETHIAYNAIDRRIHLEDPNVGTYNYTYDPAGRLVEQTAPGDTVPTVFEYNDAGDLIRKEFPDGTFQNYIYGEPGDHNAVGRLVRIEDAAGIVELSYDVRGNVSERRRTVLGKTYVTGYAYDSLGRVRRITYPDGFAVNYEYDSGGNLIRVTDGKGQIIATYANHNAAGQLKDSTFGNGVLSSFTYDDLLRMASIQTRTALGDTLQDLEYAYDEGNNVRHINDRAFGASQEFWYDEISRLVKAEGPYGEENYEYDAIGNLVRKGSLVFEVDPIHRQRVICGVDYADPIGKGKTNNPNHGTCLNTDDFRSFLLDYDGRGNVIQKGDKLYEYDSENQLIRVKDAKGKFLVENIYDAGGQRTIEKTRNDTTIFIDGIYEENKTHASRHIRAGSLLVSTIITPLATVHLVDAAPPSLYGLDDSGGGWQIQDMAHNWHWIFMIIATFSVFSFMMAPNQAKIRRNFCAVLNESYTGMKRCPTKAIFIMLFIPIFIFVSSQTVSGKVVLSQQSNGKSVPSEHRFYYHSSHLGNINVVTNESGNVVERRDYKPYGDRFDWTGPNSGPRELLLTFNGQRYDDETDLYYFGARHYDPEMGRFLNSDTQVPDPMNPKSLNRYAFAGGNPIRYNDPTGHGFWDWFAAIIVIIAVVAIGIVTAGAGAGLLLSVAGGLLFTAGMAALGAAALGIYAMTQMPGGFGGKFNWKIFGMALAAGAVMGGAVGASIVLLPFSIGTTWTGGIASFATGLACDTFIGAVLGGMGTIVQHLAKGGGPEEILTKAIGYEIATSVIKGALFGLFTGCVLNKIGGFSYVGRWLAALVSAGLTGEGIWEISKAGYSPNDMFSFLNTFDWLNIPSWYKNSPAKSLGVPDWAFEGTWLGFGNNTQKNMLAPLLQTMPMSP